ncbi:MAG TPA: DUF992 domain-containing protein [Xanthobacteraceae bacterium]|jgi:hypothetical protein
MIRFTTVALTAGLVASATQVMAQGSRVEVGVLECRGSTTSFIVGSVTELGCTFRGSDNSPPEAYHATIRRAGVDIGFPQQVAVAWAVFAPTRGIQRGDLAGSYAGASASATVGIGLGANALIGGSNNTIAFQPLSGQAQTGLSIAAGIAGMDLRPR